MYLASRTCLLSVIVAISAPALSQAADAGTQWKHPKTSWDEPDLQGMWPVSHLMSTPLERPEKFGNRLRFTADELDAQRKQVEAQNSQYDKEDKEHYLGFGHWVETTDVPAQTSLIVDPPNGRLPPQTEQGKAMSAKMGSSWTSKSFNSPADFDAWDRCITRGMPSTMFAAPYNSGIEIVQSPGYVVINLEMIHDTRIIPTRAMPPLEGDIKQWLGSSRGHWEGNALVVETTNFNGEASMTAFTVRGSPIVPRATSTTLRTVERFERTDANHLIYTVTVSDPVTQTAPWTVQVTWKRDEGYEFYEYACHEDNEAIRNYIVTSRMPGKPPASSELWKNPNGESTGNPDRGAR